MAKCALNNPIVRPVLHVAASPTPAKNNALVRNSGTAPASNLAVQVTSNVPLIAPVSSQVNVTLVSHAAFNQRVVRQIAGAAGRGSVI